MKRFLTTRPEYDETTSYLSSWTEELLNNTNISFTDFHRQQANKKNVEAFLKKKKPGLVLFNGHGNASTIFGHKGKPIIKKDLNEHLLKDKIVYTVSCESAKTLGRSSIKKGTKAYLGYSGPFSFVVDTSSSCVPQNDAYAEPFKKASNVLAKSLIEGKSSKKAYDCAVKVYNELLQKYSKSDALPARSHIRFWLFWNKEYLELLGDKNSAFC